MAKKKETKKTQQQVPTLTVQDMEILNRYLDIIVSENLVEHFAEDWQGLVQLITLKQKLVAFIQYARETMNKEDN